MTILKDIFIAGLGGFIGTALRLTISLLLVKYSKNFPAGTFAVNIIGSFLIGVFYILASGHLKLLFITGFCGGFTTFSSLSLENFILIDNGKMSVALLYIILSIILGILGVFLGLKTATLWLETSS